MRGRATIRLAGTVGLGLWALLLAMLAARPEPVALAAPFLLAALLGMGSRAPEAEVRVTLAPARVVEGDQVELTVELATPGTELGRAAPAGTPSALPWRGGTATLLPRLPRELAELVPEGIGGEVPLGGSPVHRRCLLEAVAWGAVAPVELRVVLRDRSGFFERTVQARSAPLRVLPREEVLRRVVAPRSLRSVTGAHSSRQRGEGIEFADTRPFVPGDRARSVNWRVTARRGELWVDERHPERSGEVVLFLDSFASLGEHPETTLRRSVEVAGALARRQIAANDRVGLVDLGGVFRWVRPGGGSVQLYRLAEALLESDVWASSADKSIDVLPARALPRRSLVVALSPLLDQRAITALRAMRAAGFDLVVIEVSPLAHLPRSGSRREELAQRLWQLEREAVRAEMLRSGVAVARWDGASPLDPLLDEVLGFRAAVLRWAR